MCMKEGRHRAQLGARVTQPMIILIVVVVLATYLTFVFPSFLTAGNVTAILRGLVVLALLGLAQGVVVIGRGIDLSIIFTMVVSTATTLEILLRSGSLLLALAVGVGVSAAIGVANAMLVAVVELPAFFATLASGLVIYGVGNATVLDSQIIELPAAGSAILNFSQGVTLGLENLVWALALVVILLGWLLRTTDWGRFTYAYGSNPSAARVTGIPYRWLATVHYVTAAELAFLAGLAFSGSAGRLDTGIVNSSLIYDVFTIVVIGGISLAGGRGGVGSVVAGALFIGVLQNGMVLYNLPVYQQNILKGLILLTAIAIDSLVHPRDEETVRQGD